MIDLLFVLSSVLSIEEIINDIPKKIKGIYFNSEKYNSDIRSNISHEELMKKYSNMEYLTDEYNIKSNHIRKIDEYNEDLKRYSKSEVDYFVEIGKYK